MFLAPTTQQAMASLDICLLTLMSTHSYRPLLTRRLSKKRKCPIRSMMPLRTSHIEGSLHILATLPSQCQRLSDLYYHTRIGSRCGVGRREDVFRMSAACTQKSGRNLLDRASLFAEPKIRYLVQGLDMRFQTAIKKAG